MLGERRILITALSLVVLIVAVFGQVGRHEFISLDDPIQITGNRYVQAGLTADGVSYAFSNRDWFYWVPLSILSIMADVELFGMDAGKHHLVDLALHATSTLILFLLLARMTGAVWRSGFAAALFAIHPLHVESVAWASSRVDTLCAPFYLLAMLAYVRWVERPGTARYAAILAAFALALTAKPMAVTLPAALLLLDYWPLRRIGTAEPGASAEGPGKTWTRLRSLVIEKIPLFAISFGVVVLTVTIWDRSGSNVAPVPFGIRAGNAILAYGTYLWKTVWPSRLAVFYPHPWDIDGALPLAEVALSAVVLSVLGVLAVRFRRRSPWLLAGLLWYLILLLPASGLLEINGLQGMADRYTYLPLIGLFVAVAWGVPEALGSWRFRRPVLAVSGVGALLLLSVVAWKQVAVWKDSRTLFTHALSVTEENYVAHGNLGVALFQAGDVDGAIARYREAVRIFPVFEEAWCNLGLALLKQGRVDEAIDSFRKVVELNPDYPGAMGYLGASLATVGRTAEAVPALRAAVEKNPDAARSSYYLGTLLDAEGRLAEAEALYRNALRVSPGQSDAHNNLGSLLLRAGRRDEAVVHLREAVRLNPADDVARQNLEEGTRQAP